MRIRSTDLRSARSSFAWGFVGFVIQGSISRTCPIGVTSRKAEWPYQVRRVFGVPATGAPTIPRQTARIESRSFTWPPEVHRASADARARTLAWGVAGVWL